MQNFNKTVMADLGVMSLGSCGWRKRGGGAVGYERDELLGRRNSDGQISCLVYMKVVV